MSASQKVWLVASQKGGVCKTTIATALARHLSLEAGKPRVLLCDVDFQQHSTMGWYELRGKLPLGVTIKRCSKASDVGRWAASEAFEHVVIDGAPHASRQTFELAQASDVVILPTWTGALSLGPTIQLANELADGGVPRESIIFTIVCAGSDAEIASATETIVDYGFRVSPVANRFSTAYGKALDKGLTIIESEFQSLRDEARKFIAALTK